MARRANPKTRLKPNYVASDSQAMKEAGASQLAVLARPPGRWHSCRIVHPVNSSPPFNSSHAGERQLDAKGTANVAVVNASKAKTKGVPARGVARIGNRNTICVLVSKMRKHRSILKMSKLAYVSAIASICIATLYLAPSTWAQHGVGPRYRVAESGCKPGERPVVAPDGQRRCAIITNGGSVPKDAGGIPLNEGCMTACLKQSITCEDNIPRPRNKIDGRILLQEEASDRCQDSMSVCLKRC